MSTINERIKDVMLFYDLNKNSFSSFLEIKSNSMITNIVNGKTAPSLETVLLILEKCDKIDVEWLVTGNGRMLKKYSHYSDMLAEPEELYLSEKDYEIKRLQEDNRRLLKIIENLSEKVAKSS